MTSPHPERELAEFAAALRFSDVPAAVLRRTEELFLDWVGSTLAGKGARPVESIARFMASQGPAAGSSAGSSVGSFDGRSEVLIHRTRSSPLVAASINAAASHFAEQDDVHNGSVFHPAAVVFPPALAVAQALGRSGRELLAAAIVGYEVGIRVGEFLSRSHYKVFHTTGTAGTLAAAAAVGSLLRLNADQMLNALGSAGTQSAGLWEFLRDGADSKQLHTAHAAGAGLTAAYLAADGFTGAQRILVGTKGLAAGMSSDADPARLTDGLSNGRVTRWATAETSFKVHAACRHTHPAADALQRVMREHGITADNIEHVTAQVHQGAIDVLGPVVNPQTVHQSKFSMGTVLAMVALHGRAGMTEFDAHFAEPATRGFCDRVEMRLDAEVDSAYPARWIGKVVVDTTDGRRLAGRVDEPKGDPGNTLSRAELEDKAIRLALYRGGATEAEMRALIATVWGLANAAVVPRLLD